MNKSLTVLVPHGDGLSGVPSALRPTGPQRRSAHNSSWIGLLSFRLSLPQTPQLALPGICFGVTPTLARPQNALSECHDAVSMTPHLFSGQPKPGALPQGPQPGPRDLFYPLSALPTGSYGCCETNRCPCFVYHDRKGAWNIVNAQQMFVP